MNCLNYIDFYKVDHRRQYPEGTEFVYSNFTARSSRTGFEYVVWVGLQYFMQEYLINRWRDEFFSRPKEEVVAAYQRRIEASLGLDISYEHIEQLHDLGYLPIQIKSLPEGSLVPIKVPVLTICNTLPEFFWLTNYLETILSCVVWGPTTSATTAFRYRRILEDYARRTSDQPGFIDFQGHDFSMRGMFGLEAAMLSGAGHLTSFMGTDTVPAIDFIETYYPDVKPHFIGGSVPASEHSCMCMGEKDAEFDTFKRFITELYPTGIVSIVSDTWDLWKVLTEYLPRLKEDILKRDGKVVIRPDSGDPVEILCGSRFGKSPAEVQGVVEYLWNIFGGKINSKGYKQLDPHIGVIYGDSITVERCEEILARLENKKFASTTPVFGIGSYTYTYVTRDTYGFAMKATFGRVNGKDREIFKTPVTDNGMKKSAKGLLHVELVDGEYRLQDQVSTEEETTGDLKVVFLNGEITQRVTFQEIRERVKSNL